MEIREQLIDDAKRLTWVEKDRSFRFSSRDPPGAFFSGVFEGSNNRCADGENWAAGAASLFNRRGGGIRNLVGFGVNLVVFDALGANRLESSKADVQGDFCDFDSTI